VSNIRNINFFIYLKGYLGSQQTNIKYLTLKLGKNINSNNFLEVLIAGVKLTPRVKYASKCEGNRRVKCAGIKNGYEWIIIFISISPNLCALAVPLLGMRCIFLWLGVCAQGQPSFIIIIISSFAQLDGSAAAVIFTHAKQSAARSSEAASLDRLAFIPPVYRRTTRLALQSKESTLIQMETEAQKYNNRNVEKKSHDVWQRRATLSSHWLPDCKSALPFFLDSVPGCDVAHASQTPRSRDGGAAA